MSKRDFKFDKLASRYDTSIEGWVSQRFYNLLMSQLFLAPGAKVLDVGCGTGALLQRMADRFRISGYGIDSEENMIAEACKKLPDMNIRLAKSEAMPFEERTFDALTVCMAFHHFADRGGFATEASRVLKAGGCLYIAEPCLPMPLRRVLNAILHCIGITGRLYSQRGILRFFSGYGFRMEAVARDGFAQLVVLRKIID